MTEEITNSLLSKVLEWLPEEWHQLAKDSSALLNIILNEVMSDRDVRITGSAGALRPESALIAAIHKELQREEDKRYITIVVCPSRESENVMGDLADKLCANTNLVVRRTATMRTTTIVARSWDTRADIVVTSLGGLDKIRRAEVIKNEQIRTVIIDDMEWFKTTGELNDLEHYVEGLPAARQLIGITKPGDLYKRFVDILHAPAVCRAPDVDEPSHKINERFVVVPEDGWKEIMVQLSDLGTALYIAEGPTNQRRVTSCLKYAGHDPKCISAKQTDSARDMLIRKFNAGIVPHVVISSLMLPSLKKGSITRIIHAEVPRSARSYLNHMNYAVSDGELVTVFTPADLFIAGELLGALDKKLRLENPFELTGMPAFVGPAVTREKLTVTRKKPTVRKVRVPSEAQLEARRMDAVESVRATVAAVAKIITDSDPTLPQTELDNEPSDVVETELVQETPEVSNEKPAKRPYQRKYPRAGKSKYVKKEKFERKPRFEEEIEPSIAQSDVSSEETAETATERKPYKKRFPAHNKKRFEKRPYREHRDDSAERWDEKIVTSEVDSQTSTEDAQMTDRPEGNNGERNWRPKTKYNRFRKPYSKDRRQPKREGEGEEDRKPAAEKTAREQNEQARNDGYSKKKFSKYPQKKRPYQQQKPKKPQQKPRDDWDDDDDNFGNSIHYQPRRQNLRNLRSDEPLHWEPSDPYHPSSQALSLPQMMPDENDYRSHRSRNDRKGNYNRPRKSGFKKYRGNNDR